METVIGRLTSFAASVESVTKSLEQNNDDNRIIKLVTAINDVLGSAWMQSFNKTKEDTDSENNFQLKFFAKQLEEVVVGLWNATVARQCAKTLHDRTIAVLRQLCLDLLTSPFCSYSEQRGILETKSKSYMHRRIMMSLKCGKAWLEMNEFEKAKEAFLSSQDDIKNLKSLLKKSTESDPAVENEEILMLNKQHASLLCYLVEAEASSLQYLADFSSENEKYFKEKERICIVSYNLGLKATNENRHEDTIRWLSFSFEYGKNVKQIAKTFLAQALRLLAHVYLEVGNEKNIQLSLEAVEKANSYACQPVGLHLK